PPEAYVTVLLSCNYAVAGSDYTAGAPGPAHVYSSAPGRLVMGRSHYIGVGGYYSPTWYPDYQGLFTYQGPNSLGKVPDGTSNTFLFGEMVGGQIGWGGSGGIPSGLSGVSWAAGFNYTGFGTLSQQGSRGGEWYLFGSDHTANIANFAFADGSVRGIRNSIDFGTFVYLSGFRDGVTITFDN